MIDRMVGLASLQTVGYAWATLLLALTVYMLYLVEMRKVALARRREDRVLRCEERHTWAGRALIVLLIAGALALALSYPDAVEAAAEQMYKFLELGLRPSFAG